MSVFCLSLVIEEKVLASETPKIEWLGVRLLTCKGKIELDKEFLFFAMLDDTFAIYSQGNLFKIPYNEDTKSGSWIDGDNRVGLKFEGPNDGEISATVSVTFPSGGTKPVEYGCTNP